jgi:hypothetical protein
VLALAAAVYPTLLAGVIVILGQPNPLRVLIAFLIGGMAISIVAGSAIVKAVESSGAVSESHSSTKPIVDILVGAASLLIAWAIWSGHIKHGFRDREQPPRARTERPSRSFTSRALTRGSVMMAFLAGLVLNLPGIWYLDALTASPKPDPPTPRRSSRSCCST